MTKQRGGGIRVILIFLAIFAGSWVLFLAALAAVIWVGTSVYGLLFG